jgi:hypothetical protein
MDGGAPQEHELFVSQPGYSGLYTRAKAQRTICSMRKFMLGFSSLSETVRFFLILAGNAPFLPPFGTFKSPC